MDPDPYLFRIRIQKSLNTNPIWIRIHNTVNNIRTKIYFFSTVLNAIDFTSTVEHKRRFKMFIGRISITIIILRYNRIWFGLANRTRKNHTILLSPLSKQIFLTFFKVKYIKLLNCEKALNTNKKSNTFHVITVLVGFKFFSSSTRLIFYSLDPERTRRSVTFTAAVSLLVWVSRCVYDQQ